MIIHVYSVYSQKLILLNKFMRDLLPLRWGAREVDINKKSTRRRHHPGYQTDLPDSGQRKSSQYPRNAQGPAESRTFVARLLHIRISY